MQMKKNWCKTEETRVVPIYMYPGSSYTNAEYAPIIKSYVLSEGNNKFTFEGSNSCLQMNLAFKGDSDAMFDQDEESQEEMDAKTGKFMEAVADQMGDNEPLRARMLALVREGNECGYFDS